MVKYAKEAGFWTLQKRAEYASDTLTKVSPSIQLTEFEDGAIYVHDGHHRCVSTWIAGRSYLREDEYDLRKWTYAQYLEINGPNRWWTPFDPRIHLRRADVKFFKEEAARRFNLDPHACVKWIRENHFAYRVDKAADVPTFTLPDLATIIHRRLLGRCQSCGKTLTKDNCTALTDRCDDCLATEAAEWNYSYDNAHGGPY